MLHARQSTPIVLHVGNLFARAALTVVAMGVAFAALVLAVTGLARVLTAHHIGEAISIGWSFASWSFLGS